MTALRDKSGFTLIELMLAMALFITIMVISTVGFVGMNRVFSRGTIRKQLSESIQSTTKDITATVQASPQNTSVVPCSPGDDGCANDIQARCIMNTRYYWPSDTSKGGLYRDGTSDCGSPLGSEPVQLMSDRYRVRALDVESLSEGLFRVRGAYSTLDEEAIIIDDPLVENAEYTARCRGTAESALVRSCAVEKFDVVINARGAKI